MKKNLFISSALIFILFVFNISSAFAIANLSKNPYAGAIVVDAATGKVLFEDHADAKAYPASITKLMDLLIILEAVDAKHLSLDEPVTVTAQASRIGGSQVYLKENEVFTVDQLLYALIVQSANDAAEALALHYAGTTAAFVDLMNKRAQQLGMKNTVFHSVHGLPPGKGQLPDVSTPRDISILCRALLKRHDVLKYTSTKVRPFRANSKKPFIMRSHNHLLKTLAGCDGLKTGYFYEAGFSIAATEQKDGQRAIAVVMGSKSSKVRDKEARELLSKGVMELVTNAPAPPAPTPAVVAKAEAKEPKAVEKAALSDKNENKKADSDVIRIKKSTLRNVGIIIVVIIFLVIVISFFRNRKRKNIYI